MKLKLNLAWKIVVGAPDKGVDYCTAIKHFNVKTAKNFINKIGGISSLDFYPNTLEPTNVFYNAIESYKSEYGFVGKRIPFEGTIADVRASLKIKIHQFSSDLVIISISADGINFSGSIDDLHKLISIETHKELSTLVRVICSIICSGGKESSPVLRKLKAYPYIALESNCSDNLVENEAAVELLTRHKSPKPEIVQSVISKNDDHQLDRNSILIDRQGILARYTLEANERQPIKRKFESSHYLFELAISLAHILENDQFSSLSEDQRTSITKLVTNPKIVFTKSVTAYKTWTLLLDEFRLSELYTNYVNDIKENIAKEPTTNNKEWSELKKWTMGVLSTLVVGLVVWGGSSLYQEFSPFKDKPIKLFQPLDGEQISNNTAEINFDWEDVEGAAKYILIIEKYNEKNKKWFLLESEGRKVESSPSSSISMTNAGNFKWNIVARDKDEEEMAESVWFFFEVKKVESPNKGVQSDLRTQ
ncbi:hypothetical protein FQP81_01060 [Pseudoalteromonas distincta]|uniref:hypothetical protein n=1 Tax=Pseudoalteromonas TaxID=53246 RepID=UPI000418389D|nr:MULTISPECIES: hypothetical protein [Pseudoalteromonas]TVU78051.1 hypothetical protein FQP81_01060 [Pseudoalteromonas elyakovii]